MEYVSDGENEVDNDEDEKLNNQSPHASKGEIHAKNSTEYFAFGSFISNGNILKFRCGIKNDKALIKEQRNATFCRPPRFSFDCHARIYII